MVEEKCEEDLEEGLHSLDDSSEDSLSFSESDDRSWHSPLNSFGSNAGPCDDLSTYSDVPDLEMGATAHQPRNSVSEYSDVDLGNEEDGGVVRGACKIKVHFGESRKGLQNLSSWFGEWESGVWGAY